MTALGPAYNGITKVVADLDDRGFLLPTGCHGWSIADLLLHVTLDAQRTLVALASPATGPADVNAVTYWLPPSAASVPVPQAGPPSSAGAPPAAADSLSAALEHDQWVRRSAAAFTRPTGVREPWLDTAPAAVRAAAAADPAGFITTQGLVLTVADFITTLVTEAAIHHLDLISELPGAPGPDPEVIRVARSTLDGLAGPGGLPARWNDHEALLKGSGRHPLTEADRRIVTTTFPLLS